MVREEVVRRRLAMLDGYLLELGALGEVDAEQYVTVRRQAERLLQLVVEVAVDINTHVVTEQEGMPPTSSRDSFVRAGRFGLLSADLASRLAPAAGLRNVLIHDYGDIDDQLVLVAIPIALDNFREYASAVIAWLEARARTE